MRLSTGVHVTPNHPFLCPDGQYRPVWDIIQQGLAAVGPEGTPISISGELLSGEELRTAPGYLGESDGVARVRTFNLTVERRHTYIAGGYRVHNTSLPDQIPPGFLVLHTAPGSDGLQVTVGVDPFTGATGLFAGRDLDGDGNTDLEYASIEHAAYARTIQGRLTDNGLLRETRTWSDRQSDGTYNKMVVATSGNGTTLTAERILVSGKWVTLEDSVKVDGIALDVGTIGSIFGSQLGRSLSSSPFGSAVGGVVLGAIGENLAEAAILSTVGKRPLSSAFSDAFEDAPFDLANNAIGAISSYLAAELVEALGLGGTWATIGQSASSQAIGTIATNLTKLGQVITDAGGVPVLDPVTSQPLRYEWNTGVGIQMLGNAVGGFVGTWIASELVEFDTVGGQIGSSLGAAIGSAWVATAFTAAATATNGVVLGMQLGAFAGPIGAAIGALIGFILGGLIGSLFWRPAALGCRSRLVRSNAGVRRHQRLVEERRLQGRGAQLRNECRGPAERRDSRNGCRGAQRLCRPHRQLWNLQEGLRVLGDRRQRRRADHVPHA